ncbi:uncharacterized protein DUF262 [Chitinophaga skermanii]|uniref:Uncharacterized protein DUF262 n=1 Tax=Chitinophaga skermanii TaxID=331697 RepID=A0A327QRB6_9BACT|nr:DUF262 domain-containing protein [Chitinophaga skermanii]RAJ06870.1 uncharacterized protein DUF262 [Chitinophaga skermanii]
MEDVTICRITFGELLEKDSHISIPGYQRAYLWDTTKVDALLEDLKAFKESNPRQEEEYYMGGILLYKDKLKSEYEIIDGQQRLTTLNLITYLLERRTKLKIMYSNHTSKDHIKKNYTYLASNIDLLKALDDYLEKIVFTLIISYDKDKSFLFFDTQNSRGVSLSADDFLKAYHLREVESEALQKSLATTWEQAALSGHSNAKKMALTYLFEEIIYPARQWKGATTCKVANRDLILECFQKKTIKQSENTLPLFGTKNYVKFDLHENEISYTEMLISEKTIDITAPPMEIRQPIYKGVHFFQYTQRYHTIHKLLFSTPKNKIQDKSIINTITYFENVYNADMSIYLKHFMELCLVMYCDSFGSTHLDRAIEFFDYFIGGLRLEKSVRIEAVRKSLTVPKVNLLDVIAHAYLPNEVFEFIKEENYIRTKYKESSSKEDNRHKKNNYIDRVLDQYRKKTQDVNLENRLAWIN